MRKTASSAVDGGGKIIDTGVEVVKNTDSVDHWDFLDEIEAPMWADLTLCNFTNDETNDAWFDTSHQFHQSSSIQLLSTIFHPNSITIQEPPSPKLPPSVSKSRGKNYKIKPWEKRNKPTSNNQHPVKTLSSNNTNPTSNKTLKSCSSCESGVTDKSRPKVSKSSSCSLTSQEQEHENSAMSTVTSIRIEDQKKKILEVSCKSLNQTSELLSSLRNNLRRSCATRPAARVVTTKCSEGFKSSSSSSKGINVITVSQPLRKESRVGNVTKKNVQDLSNRQRSNTLTSKVQVQKNTSVGKVLMTRKVNEIDKKSGIKKTGLKKIGTSQKGEKEGQIQKGCKQNVTQKNGSKKLIGIKQEKTNTHSRDKDIVNPTRKVYFR
ncbi:hypothetical protein L1887_39443 [Cichorium endivia]|nr:hypothetical protein L1887_39443 [Cichorium endivia]